MKNETLLDKAKANLYTSSLLLKTTTDEAVICIAAYHNQQAVELSIKHVLESSGIRYPKTHSIEDLLDLVPEQYCKIKDIVGDLAYLLTTWESKTRYIKGYKTELNRVIRLNTVASDLLVYIESLPLVIDSSQSSSVEPLRLY